MTEWFIQKNGKWHGPFSPERLKELVAQGKLKKNDIIRKGKDGKPVPAGKMKGLFENAKPESKPVPVPVPVSVPQSSPVGGQTTNSVSWFYITAGQQHGPVSLHDLKMLARDGKLEPGDLVWQEGMPAWQPANHLEGLFPTASAMRVAVPPPLPASQIESPLVQDEPWTQKRVFEVILLSLLLLSALGLMFGWRPASTLFQSTSYQQGYQMGVEFKNGKDSTKPRKGIDPDLFKRIIEYEGALDALASSLCDGALMQAKEPDQWKKGFKDGFLGR